MTCPRCGHETTTPLAQPVRFKDEVEVRYCPNCHRLFVSPKPKTAQIVLPPSE